MWLTHKPVLHQHRTGTVVVSGTAKQVERVIFLQLAEPLSMTQSPSEQFGSKLVEMAGWFTGWHRGSEKLECD